MIEINNITKSFKEKQVLFDISGTFFKGKNNLIIGSSGTGKSVLLKNIVGLFTPDLGDVKYNERSFINGSEQDRKQIRREIGMLFQGGALFDSKNIEEKVYY